MRELHELLAASGMECQALCTGVLEYERETTLDEVIAWLELPAARFQAELSSGRSVEVFNLTAGRLRVTLLPTASSRAERSPDPCEGAVFLDLGDQVLDRFRPDVLLTCGGHPVGLELMHTSRNIDRDSQVAIRVRIDGRPRPASVCRAAGQIGKAPHAQAIGKFPQTLAAGSKEAAEQTAAGKLR